MIDLVVKHKPFVWAGETGQIRKSIEPFLKKRMQQRSAYCRLEWIPRTSDKAAMARAFQALASMGKVHIPYTEWGEALISQLTSFPAGKHDDKVDVCALFGLVLEQTWAAPLPPATKEIKRDRWDSVFDDDEDEDNWKLA